MSDADEDSMAKPLKDLMDDMKGNAASAPKKP